MPDPAVPVATGDCAACTLSRRGFVSLATLGALGLVVGCGDDAVSPIPPAANNPGGGSLPAGVTRSGDTWTIDVTAANELRQFGFFVLRGAAVPALVVRVTAGYVAFDARCPHAGTSSMWSVSGPSVTCADHGSRFALPGGTLQQGPAATGLRALTSTLAGTVLTVVAS